MWVSVGQLYSSQRLLEWITTGPVRPAEIEASEISTVFVCRAADVLDIVLRGAWATIDIEGVLQLTPRGQTIRSIEEPTLCLREQLRDLISIEKPVWSKLIARGRQELLKSAPLEVAQMLLEAGLLATPPSRDVVSWWDEMNAISRGIRSAELLEVGRRGEELTLAYERRRTTRDPVWQAIESNLSGFDVLSVIEPTNLTPLRIEVKASSQHINAANFHLTRHEWDTACTTGNYVFHLWQFRPSGAPRLAVISVEALKAHVPMDSGSGEWQQTRIPFSDFLTSFNEFSPPFGAC